MTIKSTQSARSETKEDNSVHTTSVKSALKKDISMDKDDRSVAASVNSTMPLEKDDGSVVASVSSKVSFKSLKSVINDVGAIVSSAMSTKSSKSGKTKRSCHAAVKVDGVVDEAKTVVEGEHNVEEEKVGMSVASASVQPKVPLKSQTNASADADADMLLPSDASANSIFTMPSEILSFGTNDDGKSTMTEASEVKARRLLRLYGFGAGMRMYRKSLELAHGGAEEVLAIKEEPEEMEDASKGPEKEKYVALVEGRDEQCTHQREGTLSDADEPSDTRSVASHKCAIAIKTGREDAETISVASGASKKSSFVRQDDASSVFKGVDAEPKSLASASFVSNMNQDMITNAAKESKGDVFVGSSSLTQLGSENEPVVEVISESTDETAIFAFKNLCGCFWSIDEAAKEFFRKGEKLSTPMLGNFLKPEEPSTNVDITLDKMLEDIGEARVSMDDSIDISVPAEV